MNSLKGDAYPPIRQPRLEAGQDLSTPCWAALGKLCPAGDICPSTHPPTCLPPCLPHVSPLQPWGGADRGLVVWVHASRLGKDGANPANANLSRR